MFHNMLLSIVLAVLFIAAVSLFIDYFHKSIAKWC